MNLLLDTHVLLWWLDDNPTLSKRARSAIADGKNLVFLSVQWSYGKSKSSRLSEN